MRCPNSLRSGDEPDAAAAVRRLPARCPRTPLAAEIADVRVRRGGFASPEELILYCDGVTLERLELIRDRLVFVPR